MLPFTQYDYFIPDLVYSVKCSWKSGRPPAMIARRPVETCGIAPFSALPESGYYRERGGRLPRRNALWARGGDVY